MGFQEYFRKCLKEGYEFKTMEDFKVLTQEEFNEFRITYNLENTSTALTTSSTTPSKPPALSTLKEKEMKSIDSIIKEFDDIMDVSTTNTKPTLIDKETTSIGSIIKELDDIV